MESLTQKGQTFLITVFILGIITVAVTVSLAASGVSRLENAQSETKGEQSLYAARAGMEEVLYRLSTDTSFGSSGFTTISNSLDNSKQFVATISGTSEERIATATGIVNNYIRKIEIRLAKDPTAGNVVLSYAAQVGQGGISMSNGSQITGKNGADGNVYSNGIITGTNTAQIRGNAWAVGGINPSSGNITITKNAYGSVIRNCTVNGNTYSPVLPTNCTVVGTRNSTPAPSAIPMPVVDTAYWQAEAEAGGTLSNYSQSSGSTTLGPKKITGNFTLSNSAILTITGTLWVQGTFTIQNSAQLRLAESFGENGTIILLDNPADHSQGRLVIQNSGSVSKTSQGGYILFVSTNQSTSGCNPIAASFGNSSANTAIVANDGCVQISNSGSLVALAANQLVLSNGAQISYETGLSSELYLPGPGVGGSGGNFGWGITSWKEIP